VNRQILKTYYKLTKPGIIYGNLMTAAGGFFLASRGHIDFLLLAAALAGIGLVIASGCVFNNYMDQGIDKKMARTKSRALVQGQVSGRQALIYAVVLGIAGFTILAVLTNLLTVTLGVIALADYVILYGISKRRSVWGTVVGSISGALPLVGGYTAVSGQFDQGALILFLIMVCWQMPHFYAIAMYRLKDYTAANIPVLPAKKGAKTTKVSALLYLTAFIMATLTLSIAGYTGYIYTIVMVVLGLRWLRKGLRNFTTLDDGKWGRMMFFESLNVLTVFSILIAFEAWLP
jgi:heme o synthase